MKPILLEIKGLMGEDEWEAAKIDEIICNLEDVWLKVHPWIQNSTKQVNL